MIPFIITFLAGISTVLGIIPTYINSKYKDSIINYSLAFSSGVMISISILSLIPESYNYLNNLLFILIFINIGFIISSYIDKGISKRLSNNPLFNLGIVSIIALILHNIPEGITTFITSSNDLKIGINLSIGIALHNIAEGISIAIPIYYSLNSHKKAFVYTFISGFSELIGGVITYIFLSKCINNFVLGIILSITSGIMIHLSIFELLPKSLNYNNKKITISSFILGIIVIFISKYLFKI